MVRFLLSCALIGGMCSSLFSAAARAEQSTLPTVTVEFPPFTTKSGSSGASGAVTEVVERVLADMGLRADPKVLPTKRAQAEAAAGRAAMFYAVTRSAERSRFCLFTEPVFRIADVFFKHKSRDISWERIGDLSGHIIGATSGYNYAPVFLKPAKAGALKIDWISAEKPEAKHLTKLAMKRLDLVICERSVCSFLLRKHADEFADIDFIAKEIGPVRDFHVCVSKKWPGSQDLLRRFNASYHQLKDRGAFKEIRKHWGIVGE